MPLNTQSQQQALLFNAVQRKAESDIRELVGAGAAADMMVALPTLMGQPSVLDEARKVLAAGADDILRELDELARFVDLVSAHEGVEIRIDVAELAGYGYHNGAVFTVYHPEHGKPCSGWSLRRRGQSLWSSAISHRL